MHYARWTREEEQVLRANYDSRSLKELALQLGRTPDSTRTRASKLGLGNKYRPRNREDLSELIGIQSPLAAYVLGFIWADGYISVDTNGIKVLIAAQDGPEIWALLKRSANSWTCCRAKNHADENGERRWSMGISHYEFRQFLLENEYTVKTGASPDKILTLVSDELKHYWWRGYFDGDGCFSLISETRSKVAKRALITLTSCKEQDWSFAVRLFNDLGIEYKKCYTKTERGYNSSLRLQKHQSIDRFSSYIYSGEQFGLSRKRATYYQYKEYRDQMSAVKTSRFRGVCLLKGRWTMQIFRENRRIREVYPTEIEAAQAYDRWAIALFGPTATVNFRQVA